jgi:hypothetical protein
VNFKLDCKPKKLLQEILKLGLCGVLPHITIAFCVLCQLPASVASREHIFSVLKQVKNYSHSFNYGTVSLDWFCNAQYQLL